MLPSVASSENAAEPQSKNFRDDFTGQKKRPEWRINLEDKDRYTFIDNEYLLLVTKKPFVNQFIYDTTDLPENYEITIKVNEIPKEEYQGFNLSLHQDNKNNLKLYMHLYLLDNWRVGFQKTLRDKKSQYKTRGKHIANTPNFSSLMLRIRKKGIEYTGFYSIGGDAWEEVGKHVFLNLKGKPSFVPYNWSDDAPESPVKVDYFEIKELD